MNLKLKSKIIRITFIVECAPKPVLFIKAAILRNCAVLIMGASARPLDHSG